MGFAAVGARSDFVLIPSHSCPWGLVGQHMGFILLGLLTSYLVLSGFFASLDLGDWETVCRIAALLQGL